jgi:hypothetical protein
MEFDKHDLEIDGDRVWLLDADGQRLCDLNDDMRLLDFEWRISVEGGLLNFDLEAASVAAAVRRYMAAFSWIEGRW